MTAKNINYFLMDGTPNGRIKCTISNWTGVAFRIPRTALEKCKERDDLKQSGVYFLFGVDEETGNDLVYVGQAGVRKNGEGVLYRLSEHKRNADKDYWTEAIVFTTSNNSFGPTEISWLENRFCALANDAQRYIVKNGNDPSLGNVTEEKQSELEEFVEYAKIVMGVLGHKLFEPLVTPMSKLSLDEYGISENSDNLLYLQRTIKKSGITVVATCLQTAEGFVVKRGSVIEQESAKSLSPVMIAKRKNAKIDEEGILQEDILFNSPSYAAMFVIGNHANGRVEWKSADGKSLKDMESGESVDEESLSENEQ